MSAEKVTEKFLKSIRLLLLESNIFGLTTFSYKTNTFRRSIMHSISNTAAIFVYFCAIGHSIYATAMVEVDVIYRATDVIILVINCVYIVTIWIHAITNRDLFIDFLLKLIDFDVKILTMGVKINYRRVQKRILLQILGRCVVLIANIASLVYIAMLQNADLFVEGMAYFLLVVNSATCHLAIECVLMLKARFIALNRQINHLIDHFAKVVKNAKVNKELLTLNKICALHHHLSKLIKQFNEIFGAVLLLMFGVSFVIIVISIFYLTSVLQQPEILISSILGSFLSNASFIINTIYVCDVCYSTIEEANRAGELIHKIDTEDHDIRDEIEMFSLQIANEQVEFNAAGFFPINYTLVFSIIGGVTTYIIILIQLSASLAENQ